jgi:hypothetical protein
MSKDVWKSNIKQKRITIVILISDMVDFKAIKIARCKEINLAI